MVVNGRQQSWSEFLDKEKQNKLLVRFVFTKDFSEVEEFAVVYLALVGEAFHEVVRYDCSRFEAVNVHHFFYKPPKKRFLNKPKCFQTLTEFAGDIRKNWRIYRLQYLEKQL